MPGVEGLLLLGPPVFLQAIGIELNPQPGSLGNAQAPVLVAHLAALDDVACPLVVMGVESVQRHGHGPVAVYDVIRNVVREGEGGHVEANGRARTQFVGAVHAQFHAHVPGGVVIALQGKRTRVGVRRGNVGGHVAAHDIEIQRLVQGLVAVTAGNRGAVGTRRRVPFQRRQPDVGGYGNAAHEAQAMAGAEDVLEPAAHRFLDPFYPAIVDALHEPQRLALAPGRVGIDADVHVVTHQVADIVDEFDIPYGLEIAHGQLDNAEGLVLHERLHVPGIGVEGHLVLTVDVGETVPGIGRDGDLRDHGRIEVENVTKVPVKGLARDLAGEVPVGETQQAPDLRIKGVFTQDQGTQLVGLAGRAFGHAHQALVCFEFGEREPLGRPVPALRAPPRHQNPPGPHVRDFQPGRPSVFVNQILPGLDVRHVLPVEGGDGVYVIHGRFPLRMDSTSPRRAGHKPPDSR